MTQNPAGLSQPQLTALLQQYRECSAHHIVCYQLQWTVPPVAVTISGLLVAATFAYDIPDVGRFVAGLFGAVFVLTMIIAVERARVFQVRRRKDMRTIEHRLSEIGVQPLVWEFSDIVKEIETGQASPVGGLRLYRMEFIKLLRLLMYGLMVMLLVLSTLALADVFGAGIFEP